MGQRYKVPNVRQKQKTEIHFYCVTCLKIEQGKNRIFTQFANINLNTKAMNKQLTELLAAKTAARAAYTAAHAVYTTYWTAYGDYANYAEATEAEDNKADSDYESAYDVYLAASAAYEAEKAIEKQ